MIRFELLKDAGVLVVEPREALSADDFQAIARTIDPWIAEYGKLAAGWSTRPPFPAGRASAR